LNTGEHAKVVLQVGVFGNQQYLISIIDADLGLDEKH
jgi:hypothetical protein